MLKEDCQNFETCSAPMCPLQEDTWNYAWFPKFDEEICKSQSHNKLMWIYQQRRLNKLCKEGYFTLDMLKRPIVMRKGIRGLDPDSKLKEKDQLKQWYKDHPEKRELTQEEKDNLRKRLQGDK